MNSYNKFGVEEEKNAEARLKERAEQEKRICLVCSSEKPLKEFRGRVIRHLDFLQVSFSNRCKKCERAKKRPEESQESKKARLFWSRSRRMGVKSDLRVKDVRTIFSCPCFHCGSKNDVSIDMRDRSSGYTRKNSIPSCKLCSEMRSLMSEEAWKHIVPTVRGMVKIGLLNSQVSDLVWERRQESSQLQFWGSWQPGQPELQ